MGADMDNLEVVRMVLGFQFPHIVVDAIEL